MAANNNNYDWTPNSNQNQAPANTTSTINAAAIDSMMTWEPRFSRASVSDEAGVSQQRVIMYRVGICCVAVSLLWLTTLAMSTSIADAHFKTVGLSKVVTSWEKSVTVIQMEQNSYTLCANREIYECQQDFNASLDALGQRLIDDEAANTEIVTQMNDLASDCSGTYVLLTASLSEYTRQGPADTPLLYYTGVCTSEEISEVQTMIGDASEARNYAYSLSKDYTRSTSDIFAHASDSISNYSDYNVEYVSNKAAAISGSLDELISFSDPRLLSFSNALAPVTDAFGTFIDCTFGVQCNPPTITESCCDTPTVAEMYKEATDDFSASYAAVVSTLQDNLGTAVGQFDAAKAALVQAAGFCASVAATWSQIKDAAQQVGVPGADDLADTVPDIDVGNYNMPPFEPPTTPTLEGLGEFFDDISLPFLNAMNDTIQETQDDVAQTANDWANEINQSTYDLGLPENNYPNDYNPPEVELGDDEFAANTDAFLDSQATALGEIYAAPTTDDPSNITTTEVIEYFKTIAIAPSGINITVADFSTADYSFYNFLDVFSFLGFGFIVLDYAWRIYSSLHLIVKYWSASAVGIPYVDVRQFKTTQKTPAAVRIARIMTNPLVLYSIIIVAASICLAVSLSAYLPIYNEFQRGCVQTHDGTMLSRNTNAFAYNYASLSGAGQIADGLKDYDSRRNAECAGYTNKANNAYVTFHDQYQAVETQLLDSIARVDLIVKCVDFTSASIGFAPGIFEDTIHDENNNPMTHPTTLVEQSVCHTTQPELRSMAFNCSTELPACAVGCAGPSAPIIEYSTHQSSCASEDLIHSYLLKLITGVVIYICLNVSRLAFMKGLSLLFWRSVTPFGFTFIGSCSRSGKMTVNAKTLLQAETAVTISKFKIKAMGIFIFAGLIHLPWLLMLVTLA